MVTVTNHAIDSLLEGLLDAEVAAKPGEMIRVGGRSKSERLEPYNLRELTGRAGGRSISALLQASHDAEGSIRTKLQQLKRAKADTLWLEDVRGLLQLDAPQLLSSLEARSDWLHTLNESGWQVAGGGRGRSNASKAAAAGDVLAHWLASDAEGDWRLQQEAAAAEEAQRLAEQQAELGLEGWGDYMQAFEGPGYSMQGRWEPNFSAVQPANVPVATSNAFAALGDLGAATGSIQLAALTAFQVMPGIPNATGHSWQQQQLLYPNMLYPFMWQPGASVAAAAGPEVQAEEAVPAAVRDACNRRRSLDELLLEQDACLMSRHERQALLQYLTEQLVGGFADALQGDIAALEHANVRLRQEYDSRDLQTLRRARVVGMTTSGVARMQNLVAALQPKVLLIEEAGELLEAHTLASLSAATEHVILIGDHEQLRPKPQHYPLEAASGRGYDLDVSAFERLASSGSIPVVTLQEQRRMRPDISRLIRAPIYPSLRDHPSVTACPPVRGMAKPLFMLAHSVPEGGQGGDEGRSKFNRHEVELAVGLASYLIKQGYSSEGDLVILTPYVGQLRRLTKAVAASNMRVVLSDKDSEELAKLEDEAPAAEAAAGGNNAGGAAGAAGAVAAAAAGAGAAGSSGASPVVADMQSCLRLATIDNFQGEEATVVILSLVRSRPDGNIGFLRLRNRINVLLSRAKHGMYLLGNADTLRAAAAPPPEGSRRPAAPMWGQVLDMLEENGCVGKELGLVCQKHGNHTRVCQPDDFELLAGDGGCQLPCDERLPCGHACHRRCHADDPKHVTSRCLQPCARLCAAGLHACGKLCYQECGRCLARVDGVQLPCGHAADSVPCYQAQELSLVSCQVQVTVQLPCGHVHTTSCTAAAHLAANPHTCPAAVQLTLPACGHTLSCTCSEVSAKRLDPRACKVPCGALLPGCLHACESSCGSCMGLSLGQLMQLWVQAVGQQQGGEWEGLSALCRERMAGVCGEVQLLKFLQGGHAAAAKAGKAKPAGRGAGNSSRSGSSAIAAAAAAALDVQRSKLANSWLAWLQQLQQRMAKPDCPSTGSSSSSSQLPTDFTLRHPSCKLKCSKPLSCGHPCSSSCHSGKPCPPCSARCPVACQHTRCGKGCSVPCAPCAEPCGWSCSHQGACSLPCGAPCDRLPCNKRCERKLKCGHRCPGLCGEACLQGCCVHLKCRDKLKKAKPELMEQVVDFTLLSTFADLDDAAVDADPLQLLPCGHVFSTSTLDGWMDMAEAYEGLVSGTDSLTSWTSPKALPADVCSPKTCPAGGCTGLVAGLRRYGRPANKALLDLIQRKQLEEGRLRCQQLSGQLQALKAEVDRASEAPASKQGFDLLLRCSKTRKDLEVGLAQQQSPPNARVREGCMAALKRLQAEQQLTAEQVAARQQLLLMPRPDTTICGRFAQGIAELTEQHLRVGSSDRSSRALQGTRQGTRTGKRRAHQQCCTHSSQGATGGIPAARCHSCNAASHNRAAAAICSSHHSQQ
ncbi:AAA domain-containing protein [Scenedesmus sp. NREL 46B-D3]|nr:AAA domain-containing protein [Scenedesmus sp. NREL 46B-D3]